MQSALFNHLWQSTLFAAVMALLTLALRKNHARVRYGVWLAASVKFLIPISWLIALAGTIPWRIAPDTIPSSVTVAMAGVSQPFSAPEALAPVVATPERTLLPVVLLSIWACGFLAIGWAWMVRWRRIRAAVRAGSAIQLEISIPAILSPAAIEPGVFGIFRPVLLLPQGIADRLTQTQLGAVIAHELCHVRYRDNLTAAIHMFVETVFWFHPMVWWIGKRMIEERERACDEEVLRLGTEPQAYAEGILSVCRLYTESPLQCVSGITGPDLRKRIEAIMSKRVAVKLSTAKKMALVAVSVAAFAVPLVIGVMNVTAAETAPEFSAASIKPKQPVGCSRGCGLRFTPGRISSFPGGVNARQIVLGAYHLSAYELSRGPAWLDSDMFDLEAKSETAADESHLRLMLQTLLSQRFKLTAHHETREAPVYALTVGKNGLKPHEIKEGDPQPSLPESFVSTAAALSGTPAPTLMFRTLSQFAAVSEGNPLANIGRPVLDETGLRGQYFFTFSWDPKEDYMGAVEEQLGLKFVAKKAALDFVVIDHIERPSEN